MIRKYRLRDATLLFFPYLLQTPEKDLQKQLNVSKFSRNVTGESAKKGKK